MRRNAYFDMTVPSARRINALARKLRATRYLELGVVTGRTFFDVESPAKTAVSPIFLFQKEKTTLPGCEFFQVVPDIFFYNLEQDRKFDIIYMHHSNRFKEILRSFCTSLAHAHRETVWIVGDTVPTDTPSAQYEGRAALARSQEGRSADPKSLSDVYKVVFMIHDFFPQFSYCTVVSGGDPQTIIWQCKRIASPRFNDADVISRLSHGDLESNIDLMLLRDEQDALDRVGCGALPAQLD